MSSVDTNVEVELGFLPEGQAIADPDHPGLLRAGPRAGAPYGDDRVALTTCIATDCVDDAVVADLLTFGFDTADLTSLPLLQEACAQVRQRGRIDDDEAATIRAELEGATLRLASGRTATVLFVADEGFIMRSAGPNGLSLMGPDTRSMNGHGVATSVHADQDVYGVPLVSMMDGRAPSLFRHDSPDGHNHDAELMLVNVWIPLQQVTQPLVLADGRTVDRPRHQLRYGLATEAFLDRDDELAINDIWAFLPDPGQRWYLRSEMDHRHAYVFNTLSTPHGSGTLPGEDVAERCYRALEAAEVAAERGDAAGVEAAVATVASGTPNAPAALRAATDAMAAVLEQARRDPTAVSGSEAATWIAASRAARRGVVRMSLELRLVVSVAS